MTFLRPTASALHRVHDLYLINLVESYSLCPFSAKAREQGRVVRVLLRMDQAAGTMVSPDPSAEVWHGPSLSLVNSSVERSPGGLFSGVDFGELKPSPQPVKGCPFVHQPEVISSVNSVKPPHSPSQPLCPEAEGVVKCLNFLSEKMPEVEVFLLTFIFPGNEDQLLRRVPAPDVVPEGLHPWLDRFAFEAMMREVGTRHLEVAQAKDLSQFYFACFHPQPFPMKIQRAMTPGMLVHEIRRTPDPVIQAVRVDVMESLRAQHRKSARRHLLEDLKRYPSDIAEMVMDAPDATESLSDSIDRNNFSRVGPGSSYRKAFKARLESIMKERTSL